MGWDKSSTNSESVDVQNTQGQLIQPRQNIVGAGSYYDCMLYKSSYSYNCFKKYKCIKGLKVFCQLAEYQMEALYPSKSLQVHEVVGIYWNPGPYLVGVQMWELI